MSEYGAVTGFERSHERFESMVAEFGGQRTAVMTHDQVEELLAERGRELLRQFMQDHADLRAAREPRREGVVDRDGVVRTRVERGHQRGMTTVFGPIMVERMAYRTPGAVNLYPADADWNTGVVLSE